MTTIWLPIMIMSFIWLVNYAIWWIIWAATAPADRADALDDTQYSGGAFYIFVYMLVLGITVIAMTFPFALGYSVTRRDFYLGTSLTFVLLAAGYAIGVHDPVVRRGVDERLGPRRPPVHLGLLRRRRSWERLFIVFVGLLFFFFVGSISAIDLHALEGERAADRRRDPGAASCSARSP